MPIRKSLALIVALAISPVSSAIADQLLVCGWDKVFLLETSASAPGKAERLWTWDAKQSSDLPESLRATFKTTDDCKPVDGGSRVLISSSSGGCALVARPSGRAVWYARVPNAHSVEMLPRDRIVTAASTHAKGNRLMLFDVARPDQLVWEAPLYSAHGVVWDAERRCLWALGFKELQCYELEDWDSDKPALTMKASYTLPSTGGHDLQPQPKSSDLILTTGWFVYLFDRDKHTFRLHPELGKRADVKSVCVHPRTGQTVFVQATESWWSDTLVLLDPAGKPAGKIQLPKERLYKARWLVPDKKETPVSGRSGDPQ